MKSVCLCALLLLAIVSVAQAQVEAPKPVFDEDNAPPDFSAASAAKATLPDLLAVADSFSQLGMTSAPHLSTTLLAEPATADLADPAAPSPKPRFVYGGRDDYRWQLGLGFAWFHFRSTPFNADTFGVKTSVAYFLNEWLGVEGTVTGGFTPATVSGADVNTLVYGGGPKIAWRQKRWEPWLHGIFGGAHENPQTALGSHNSYSITAGGGADYRWNPHLSFRAEGNYVRTAFFHQSQNNFELAVSAVLHF